MQAVSKLKRLAKQYNKEIKVGHFGTLDPFARGLMVVSFGSCARLADYFHADYPKTYRGIGLLGEQTDTADCEGVVIRKEATPEVSERELKDILQKKAEAFFLKQEYWQVPPSFSAVKINGRPSYELARQGIKVTKPAVLRQIFSFEVLNVFLDPIDSRFRIEFEAKVSSGTYVRTLFEDLCALIGNTGHLIFLERSEMGPFSLQSKRILTDELLEKEEIVDFSSLINSPYWHEMVEVMPHWPTVELEALEESRYLQGREIIFDKKIKFSSGEIWVKNTLGETLGVGMITRQEEAVFLRPKINLPIKLNGP